MTNPFDEECLAEFIDGVWVLCGCPACRDQAREDEEG
jgi:hypothetical protein